MHKKKIGIIAGVVCTVTAIAVAFCLFFCPSKEEKAQSVENGYSAYTLAVQYGYSGTLRQWVDSLETQTPYEIATANGYTGDEATWDSQLEELSGSNTTDIVSADFSGTGDLIISLADGSSLNLGTAISTDDARISNLEVNDAAQLEILYSDGKQVNVDKLVSATGTEVINSDVAIDQVSVSDAGQLQVALSNGTSLDLGTVGKPAVRSAAVRQTAFAITSQPQSKTVAPDTSVQFTVQATGAASYRWQYRRNETASWSNTTMEGCNTDTLTVKATTGRNGYQYHCIITGKDGSQITSDPVTLTVRAATVLGFISQPEDQIGAIGQTVQFSVKAEGATAYQWQYRKTETSNWINTALTGYNTDTLSVEVLKNRDGYQYHCVITGEDGTQTTSDLATLTIGTPGAITAHPTDQTGTVGATVVYKVTAIGAVSYQWQYQRSETGKWYDTSLTGFDTDTLTVEVTTSRNNYRYRCVITDIFGTEIVSDPAKLTVGTPVVAEITKHPVDQTAADGAQVQFSVETTGEVTYQWQYSKNNGTNWYSTSMTGCKTATLTVDVLQSRDGYQYRCLVTASDGTVLTSDPATLYVQAPVVDDNGCNCVSGATLSENGELILQFADGNTINLGRVKGNDGVGIADVTLSDAGDLSVKLTSGTVLNLGNIKGADGIGIQKSEINMKGELVITYTNGTSTNLGKVTGRDGAAGVGISKVNVTADGVLQMTLTDGSLLDLGNIKGDKGDKGDTGVGVADAYVNEELHLILILTDGTEIDAGYVGVPTGSDPVVPDTYTVTFRDWDGTVLKTETVAAGQSATAPAAPTRTGYTFTGWDKTFDNITSSLVITALYEIESTDPQIIGSHVTTTAGATKVIVTISVKNNPGILGMLLSVEYDESVLTLTGSANGEATAALTYQKPSKMVSGCNFVWYGTETGEVIDGTVLTLEFTVASGASAGSYPICISYSEADTYDAEYNTVSATVTNGMIVVP